MNDDINKKIKKAEATALTYETKGKREWAYAKNGKGNEHYAYARDAFERAARCRAAAEKLKKNN